MNQSTWNKTEYNYEILIRIVTSFLNRNFNIIMNNCIQDKPNRFTSCLEN